MDLNKKCFCGLLGIEESLFDNMGYNPEDNVNYSFGGGRWYSLFFNCGDGEGHGDDYYDDSISGDGRYQYSPIGMVVLLSSFGVDWNKEKQDLNLDFAKN